MLVAQLPVERARGAVQKAGDYLTGVLNWRVAGELYHRIRVGAGLGNIPFIGFGDGAHAADLGSIQYDATNDRLNISDMAAVFNTVSQWWAAGDTSWRVRIGSGFGGVPFIGFGNGASGSDLASIQYDPGTDTINIVGANLSAGLTATTFSGTITSTGASLKLGDGTAAHGDIRLLSTALGSSINLYASTADADNHPIAQLLSSALNLGPGGAAATDVSLSRTGAAAVSLTGALTLVNALALQSTLTSTGGRNQVGDGTAGHGDVRLLSTAFGSSINLYASTADADNRPIAQLLSSALNLGPGGAAATDISLSRTGAAAASFTGQLTIATGLTIADTKDITISGTTGTKIGQTGSKIGFFGATPVAAKTGWGTPSGTLLRSALANPTYTTTGGTGATAGAFDTAAHRDNIITDLFTLNKTVQALITDLKSLGVINA
jgi:hypothetical protein